MRIGKLFIGLIICCNSFFGISQHKEEETMPSVKVIALAEGNSILLRWAVDNPVAWKRANTYGYTIERFTISRNGTLINPPERKILTSTPLLPKPLEQWQTIVESNDHAAILAQALYGESFQVEGAHDGALPQIINKSRELDQRFSFALFAADINFEAAKMAGLGYVDTNINVNEKYFYKIKTAIPENFGEVELGSIAVDPKKETVLPAPIDLFVVEGDKNIMLSWEYKLFKTIYTSYVVERSDNSTDFKRLSDLPLVNLNDKPDAPAERMYYIDTLPQNNKTYYYRVVGLSPFGKEGKLSEVISGQGKPTLEYTAHLKNYTLKEDGSVALIWDFPKKAEVLIKGFELNRADKAKGPYEVVVADIPSNKRDLIFNQLKASNYFTITVKGTSNNSTTSLPIFVQPVDSIPPKTPVGLKGIIDTTGVAKISWTINTETDLLGYRVFRGNRKGEEPVQLTSSPIEENTFTDTVQVASLNSKVYYSIVAVDQRFNMSDYSKILEVEKPDIVPPTSPIFSNYKVQNDTVRLGWIPSSNKDVLWYELFRKDVTNTGQDWKKILQTKTDTTYTDIGLQADHKYRYAIFAIDKNGLRSEPSTPLTVSIGLSKANLASVKGIQGIPNKEERVIKVSWRNPSNNFAGFIIYKKKNEEKPRLFRELPGNILHIQDKTVTPNNTYTYYVKPILQNGKYGVSGTVIVKY